MQTTVYPFITFVDVVKTPEVSLYQLNRVRKPYTNTARLEAVPLPPFSTHIASEEDFLNGKLNRKNDNRVLTKDKCFLTRD